MLFRELTPVSYENRVQHYVTTQGIIQLLNATVNGILIHYWPLMGIYMYIYVYVYIHIYIYTYIQT
jgi:hypothetical protein